MTQLKFHPGDMVKVVDLTERSDLVTHCGLPLEWSGRIAKVTKAVEVYGGSYYYLGDCLFRFPAEALELVRRTDEGF